MDAVHLPESVHEIDAAWLTCALRASGLDVRVTAVERGEVIHTTCTKARFALEYDRDIGLPPRMILKGGFEPHSRRLAEMNQWEARFYSEIAPEIGLNVPKAFYSGVDPSGWRAAVLMEDLTLRDVRFCRAQEPFDFDHLRRRLEMLAGLHARTWQSPDLSAGGRWNWVASRFGEFTQRYYAYYLEPARWRSYTEAPRGAAVSAKLHDGEWMGHALARLSEIEAQGPVCLIHGDTHPGNLYLEGDGTPGFLDPTVSRSAWWLEVGYHLVAATDIGDRRRWEGALLEHYLTALEHASGPRIAFDEAWLRYRQSVAYGLFIFLINETTFQSEAVNTAYTARFAAAAIDHDTVDLLS